MHDAISSTVPPVAKSRRTDPFNLPNCLTYGRIVAVPLVVACLVAEDPWLRWPALLLFIAAGVSDWLDGYLARAWEQQSTLGRMLDPIADKLIVGAALLMLVHDNTISGSAIWAAVVILCREILVSGLREFLAELNVKIHVTRLAKWKTAVQMIALAVLLAGPAGDRIVPGITALGTLLLWLAALLTLWTGYDYLKAGVTHAMEHEER
jgi:CDP-diacylglycerol--glycerol-3-phosphate 3-phosphatidyltransferase/cardiolipin synthase